LGDLRKTMLPIHLEAALFLNLNRKHWDVKTIDSVMNNSKYTIDLLTKMFRS
jgi:hypothetical protein